MKYQMSHSGNTLTATLSDALSFSDASVFREILREFEQEEIKHCVLDMKAVPMIDSAGVGMLLVAHDSSKKHGVALLVRGATGHVRRVLELAKLESVLNIEW